MTLYDEGIKGRQEEFLAYRILDCVYTASSQNINRLLAELSVEQKQWPAVQHALGVRAACALNDYHKFFRLYQVCRWIVEAAAFVNRVRLKALIFCSSYHLRSAFPPDRTLQTLASS